jgi:magnesium chelatase family protein
MDLHVEVPRVAGADLVTSVPGEPSADIRARVVRARAIQAARGAGLGTTAQANGTMPPACVRQTWGLDGEGGRFLGRAIDRLGLSARAYERIVRVARTIADLEGAGGIRVPHLAEALGYRSLDRPADPGGPEGP